MNLNDYANDIGKSVEEVMSLCDSLGIKYEDENSFLADDDIIMLDNNLPPDESDEETVEDYSDEEELIEEDEDDIAEELAKNTKIDLDNSQKFEKVKKKQVNKENKTNFLKERKKIYKHREKLQSNEVETDENTIIYKEGMTVSDLAKELEISVTELIKKLIALGVMANQNESLDFDTVEVLVGMSTGKIILFDSNTGKEYLNFYVSNPVAKFFFGDFSLSQRQLDEIPNNIKVVVVENSKIKKRGPIRKIVDNINKNRK